MKKNTSILVLILAISHFAMAQNVGVGTNTPTEKLEVNGNVKANAFKYATPKTFLSVVTAPAFQKQSESDLIERNSMGTYCYSANFNPMSAHLSLPQGATITSITAYYYDASVTADISVHLIFNYYLGFNQSIANVNSSGDPGFSSGTDNTISAPVLVNFQNGYYTVEVHPVNATWPGPDMSIRSVIISYTMPETN